MPIDASAPTAVSPIMPSTSDRLADELRLLSNPTKVRQINRTVIRPKPRESFFAIVRLNMTCFLRHRVRVAG